jgi:hypothetical protein
MAYQSRPIYGPQWDQILQQALGAYRGVKGIQQQEAMQKSQAEALSRKQGREEQTYQRQQKQWSQEDADRAFKNTVRLASGIKGLEVDKQLPIIQQYIQDREAEGNDPKFTKKLYAQLSSGDKDQIVTAQNAINIRHRQGVAAKLIPEKKEPLEEEVYLEAIAREKNPERKAKLQQAYERKFGSITPKKTGAEKLLDAIDRAKDPKRKAQLEKAYERQYGEKPPSTVVQVGGKKETAYEEETGKGLAKSDVADYNRVIERGQLADDSINSLMQMKTIDVSQGKFEPMKQALGSFLEGAVPGSAKRLMDVNVAAGESFTAIAGDLVLKKMQAQKGPQTESDMKQIRTTVANLGNTPEGNEFILNSALASELRAQEMRDFYNEYRSEKGNLKGANKAWREKIQTVPMISSVPMTETGLPMFFWQYKQAAAQKFPNKTDREIEDMWNADNKRLEQERKGITKQGTSRGF